MNSFGGEVLAHLVPLLSMSKKEGNRLGNPPHYNVGTWEPSLVEGFLVAHGFELVSIDGDDALWRGKAPSGEDAQVAFPVRRLQLTPGTMRDSVMRHSGYDKKHWDLWRSLGKRERKSARCCFFREGKV